MEGFQFTLVCVAVVFQLVCSSVEHNTTAPINESEVKYQESVIKSLAEKIVQSDLDSASNTAGISSPAVNPDSVEVNSSFNGTEIVMESVNITECADLEPEILKEIVGYEDTVRKILHYVVNGTHKGETYEKLEKFVDTFGPRMVSIYK